MCRGGVCRPVCVGKRLRRFSVPTQTVATLTAALDTLRDRVDDLVDLIEPFPGFRIRIDSVVELLGEHDAQLDRLRHQVEASFNTVNLLRSKIGLSLLGK